MKRWRMLVVISLASAGLALLLVVAAPANAQSNQTPAGNPPTEKTGKPKKSGGPSSSGTETTSKSSSPAQTTSNSSSATQIPSNSSSATETPSESSSTTETTSKSTETKTPDRTDVVWADTATRVYYYRGSPHYGKTEAGQYMIEADAIKKGYHAAKESRGVNRP
jgi:cytoskeletal protein RodZ